MARDTIRPERPDREALAHNIRRLRQTRNWSQEELADAAGGLRQAAISEIENGRGNPTLDTLEHIAAALGCRVRDLFKPRRSSRRGVLPTV
jgi:transcriptional regulator with XRE-family HTH domain